ncbi:MAG: hypothetical protein GY852_09470 [bacterium]|nr:hypothetical protein [bacterium]
MMKNNMKGQAAMEYLMTYGWALLAIVIVIAALIYLNPFRAPELCLFQQQGFSCSEPNPQVYLDDDEVNMNVRIWNKLGKTVVIESMACTDAQVSEIDRETEAISASSLAEDDQNIPTGTSEDFIGLTCIHADGSEIEMSPNQEFRGKLLVWYSYTDDIAEGIYHEAQANVISVVVGESGTRR